MSPFKAKLNLIFIPYLIIAFSVIGVYTLFNYIFLIRWEVFLIKKMFVEFFIPVALPWIPLVIWLRPRVKFLKLKVVGRRDPVFNIVFFAGIIIALATGVTQAYVTTATGKLSTLYYPGEINKHPKTKYYKFHNYFICKRFSFSQATVSISGKHSENYDMNIYAAFPLCNTIYRHKPTVYKALPFRSPADISKDVLIILDDKRISKSQLLQVNPNSIEDVAIIKPIGTDTAFGPGRNKEAVVVRTEINKAIPMHVLNDIVKAEAWVCVNYEETISNKQSGAEKEAALKKFIAKSEIDLNSNKFSTLVYFDRIPYSGTRIEYQAVINMMDPDLSNSIILEPVYKPFEKRNGNKLWWLISILVIGSALFLLIINFFSLRPQYLNETRN